MDFQKIFSQSGKKPQSILKIVLSISVVMLVMWLFLVSKVDTGNITDSEQQEVQERTDGLKQSLITEKSASQTVEKKESKGLFQNAFITFIVMVGGLGGVWYWSKRKGDNTGGNQLAKSSREIGGYVLNPTAQLKFLEINEEVWVMAVTESSVDLLHRIPKAEWKENDLTTLSSAEAEKPVAPIKDSGKGDFKSLYKFFSN